MISRNRKERKKENIAHRPCHAVSCYIFVSYIMYPKNSCRVRIVSSRLGVFIWEKKINWAMNVDDDDDEDKY